MKKIKIVFITLIISLNIGSVNIFAHNCDVDGHVYDITITKKATASSNGERLYSCKHCTHSYSEVILAGHQWSEWKPHTEATCTKKGKEYRECHRHSNSPHYEYRDTAINPDNHNYQKIETKNADCDKEGYTLCQCTRCKDSYKEVIPALEHQYSDWIVEKEATETKEGLRYKVCEHNHNHRIEESIPQLNTYETLKKKDNQSSITVPYTDNYTQESNPSLFSVYDYTLIAMIVITTLSFTAFIYYDYLVISWNHKKKEDYFKNLKEGE